jgi:hypothetical protein
MTLKGGNPMSQVARPAADVSVDGWSPPFPTLFAQINDAAPPYDNTYAYSSYSPKGDEFTVDFPPLAPPVSGTHELTVRLRKTGSDITPVRVKLLRGDGQTVAVRKFEPAQDVFTDYVFDLTAAEIAAIGDFYSDLRLNVMAVPAVKIGCCPAKVLETLTGTVTNKAGTCTCLPDVITLTWSPGTQWAWFQTGCTGCVGPLNVPIALACQAGGTDCTSMTLSSPNFVGAPYRPQAGCTCPLNLVYNCTTADGGSFTLTITEGPP